MGSLSHYQLSIFVKKKIRSVNLTEDEKIELENSLNHLITFYEKAIKIFNNKLLYDN